MSALAPPHNLEAEQGVLGAILIWNAALEKVSELLKPEHFFDPLHGQIYETCLATIGAGKLANPITLKPFFEACEPISPTLTVPQYLGTLAAKAVSAYNAADYARTIVDLSLRRALILLGEDILAGAYGSPAEITPRQQIEEAEGRLFALGENTITSREVPFGAAIAQAVELANRAYKTKGALNGVKTGLIDLDEKIGGGLQNGDLVVLAGRPSMGKTALATNIACNVAFQQLSDAQTGEDLPWHVHFFSQEMSAVQLAMRLLGQHSEISSERLRRGQFTADEFARVMAEAERLTQRSMTIDETGALTLGALAAKARRMKRKRNTSLIVVDYIQLMRATTRRENRVQDITEITGGLKALSKELDVPILALSQLSRAVEARDNKRPQLSDLRESGSIEQDADVVMFVYRDDYYLERAEPDPSADVAKQAEWKAKMAAAVGQAEVILAKQRSGPTGIVHLAFNSKLTQFSSLARSEAAVHLSRAGGDHA